MMKKILFMLICALSVLLGVYAYEYLLWTKEYKYNVEGSSMKPYGFAHRERTSFRCFFPIYI